MLPQPATPDEASAGCKTATRRRSRRHQTFHRLAGSAGSGKTHARRPIAAAAVSEAHAHDRLVFTHPSNVEGVASGARMLTSTFSRTPSTVRGIWSEQMIAQMKAASTCRSSRLSNYGSTKLAKIRCVARGLAAISNAGSLPPMRMRRTNPIRHRCRLHDGLRSNRRNTAAMSRAGLTPMQILASLTTAPAERFGESE